MIWHRYIFWLGVASLAVFVLERSRPWRPQRLLRPGFGQDLFWLIFNGYFLAIVFAGLFAVIYAGLETGFTIITGSAARTWRLIHGAPLPFQVPVYLVTADLLEWLVHNALHRNGILWRFHRLHHSIKVMDWIGNFRFHWGEVIVYKSIKYLPLAVLGARWETILIVAVIATVIGHLNHANLNISWGALRYVLNSPRMHIWHHEKGLRGKAGVNFGVVFSFWDWLFGTAYMPADGSQPTELGFENENVFSQNLFIRFFLPFRDFKKSP